MNTAPTDNKAPKRRLKYVSHYESETLYWQFCWYLVPSKLTTHRHCRLLSTRSWSHKQSKLMCCQLSKKYKIKWIGLWTRSCCQSKRQASRFQSWIAFKKHLTYASLIQMRLPDSRIWKEQRHICWFIHYWHPLYQLPGSRPGCLSQNMHSSWLQVAFMMKNKSNDTCMHQ